MKTTKASPATKPLTVPRPSASILLLSSRNEILLLHRVHDSSAFPSAHVFPGGNLSSAQDGIVPEAHDWSRHEDSEVYRLAAIRECFEESGLLLVKVATDSEHLIDIEAAELERARRQIHANKVKFLDWVHGQGGQADTPGLIPFTRWITPMNVPRRFTTQMYLYFLPFVGGTGNSRLSSSGSIELCPSADGGLEHTTAQFFPIKKALELARIGTIILYPPQFFLLHLLDRFVSGNASTQAEIQKERAHIVDFINSGNSPWLRKCISPLQFAKLHDGRTILALDKPGPELEESGSPREGTLDYVVLVKFEKGVPTTPEVVETVHAMKMLHRTGKL